MKVLQQIWDDVRQGENIDLYLTVLVAVTLTMLNILGVAPSTWLMPITLAVLSMLAISSLGNRHRLERILENETAESLFGEEYPATLKEDLSNASELWLIGQNLARTIVNLLPTLETKIAKGDSIKILVINPGSSAVKFANTRLYFPLPNEQQYREKILSALLTLSPFGKARKEQFEIRTVDYPLAFGAFAINPNTPHGIIYMEQYGFKIKNDIPKMVLRPKDGIWYDVYKDQITALWQSGESWDYSREPSTK